MTLRAARRAVLLAGLVGSFAFVFGGIWLLLSRVWARSFTQTLEVMVAAPFLTIWVLSPILWAAWPRDEPDPPQDAGWLPLLTALALVGVAAAAYLYEFVVLPGLFDVQPRLRSLLVVAAVPAVQWAVLAAGAALGWAVRRPEGPRET